MMMRWELYNATIKATKLTIYFGNRAKIIVRFIKNSITQNMASWC